MHISCLVLLAIFRYGPIVQHCFVVAGKDAPTHPRDDLEFKLIVEFTDK